MKLYFERLNYKKVTEDTLILNTSSAPFGSVLVVACGLQLSFDAYMDVVLQYQNQESKDSNYVLETAEHL